VLGIGRKERGLRVEDPEEKSGSLTKRERESDGWGTGGRSRTMKMEGIERERDVSGRSESWGTLEERRELTEWGWVTEVKNGRVRVGKREETVGG
jgi:hypothetical protein